MAALNTGYNMLNGISFSKCKNQCTIHSETVTYGIDWNTGLTWQRAYGQGVPVYCEAFKTEFKIKLDKQFQYKI